MRSRALSPLQEPSAHTFGQARQQEGSSIKREFSRSSTMLGVCVCVWGGGEGYLTVQVMSVSMGRTRPYKSPHTISKIYLQDGKMKLSSCNLKSIQEVALLTAL